MAGNLNDLAIRLRKRADDLPERLNGVKQKVARTIINDLAHVTPVDTSQAISNWQVQNGSSADAPIGPHFAGKHGSTYAASARQTIEEGEAEIRVSKPGEPIYISNVLRYIGRLNEGSSTQTPAGFVERAVLLGRVMVEKAKLFK